MFNNQSDECVGILHIVQSFYDRLTFITNGIQRGHIKVQLFLIIILKTAKQWLF